MNWMDWIWPGRRKPAQPRKAQRVRLAIPALDEPTDRRMGGMSAERSRPDAERQEQLRSALEAWRVNPLIRRVVALTSQYVVGNGMRIEADHPAAQDFLERLWNERLNRLEVRITEWCDELTRSGNLFVLLSTGPGGMSYVRAIPAERINTIESSANDLEQASAYWETASPEAGADLENWRGKRWPAYDALHDAPDDNGQFASVVLHYAINRPVGSAWGEADIAPLLRWAGRYAAWLEDRARLNRYRNTFLFWVRARFQSEGERMRRQAELSAQPPSPGSILVTDESENWTTLHSNLAAFEAGEDGLALKKMLAAGAGVPLHFLAEPEGSTRTTAEAAGGPTFRHFEQRQRFFAWMLQDLLSVALRRRTMIDTAIPAGTQVRVRGADISGRDNAGLALAALQAGHAFGALYQAGLIDADEYLRMCYRFAGESASQPAPGNAAPSGQAPSGLAWPSGQGLKVDLWTGEARLSGAQEE